MNPHIFKKNLHFFDILALFSQILGKIINLKILIIKLKCNYFRDSMTTEKYFQTQNSLIFDKYGNNFECITGSKNENLFGENFFAKSEQVKPNLLHLSLPEKQFYECSKNESTYESLNSHSFSKMKEHKKSSFNSNSAFTKRSNLFSSNSYKDIFLYPTMYQKIISTSEKLGLKFHQMCKTCQDNIFFSKNNYSKNIYLKNLKSEQVFSFFFKSVKKNSKEKKFEVSNLKKKRKMDRDCIHKKIKARLFKFIKEVMKSYMLDEFSNLKIQQKVISDVTLDYNKKLLGSPICSVFVESNLYFASKKQVTEICKKNKEEELINFLGKSVKDCYEIYLSSENFQRDLEKFKNDQYVDAFKAYSLGFIDYYNQETNYRKYKKV
jgi:hypothetical protein